MPDLFPCTHAQSEKDALIVKKKYGHPGFFARNIVKIPDGALLTASIEIGTFTGLTATYYLKDIIQSPYITTAVSMLTIFLASGGIYFSGDYLQKYMAPEKNEKNKSSVLKV